LYRVDVATGRAEILARLERDFSTVGFEVHPQSGRMYACTGDAVLYEIDPASGSVAAVGPLDHPGNCGNLAAARGAVACVGA
jgi:hypothetical protein